MIKSITYPPKITLSREAELYLERLGVDLILGDVDLWQLSPALLQLWELAHTAGRQSRQHEIDALNWTADRLYAEVCRRTPPRIDDRASYASLERIRGNHANATRIDQDNARRFGTAA